MDRRMQLSSLQACAYNPSDPFQKASGDCAGDTTHMERATKWNVQGKGQPRKHIVGVCFLSGLPEACTTLKCHAASQNALKRPLPVEPSIRTHNN